MKNVIAIAPGFHIRRRKVGDAFQVPDDAVADWFVASEPASEPAPEPAPEPKPKSVAKGAKQGKTAEPDSELA